MIKKLLFMLLVTVAAATSANASSGKSNYKIKEVRIGDFNVSLYANCDSDKIVTVTKAARVNRVEEYVWMLPQDQDGDKMYEEQLKKGILDLYKWYLQNESRINSNEALNQEQAPLKVDAKTLQQYFQFVKNNFPGLSEDDLTDGAAKKVPAQTTPAPQQPQAVNHKKYAPVSTRDEMETQMSLPVNNK
jgi:hypothetical protein